MIELTKEGVLPVIVDSFARSWTVGKDTWTKHESI